MIPLARIEGGNILTFGELTMKLKKLLSYLAKGKNKPAICKGFH